ncbi:MAG: folate-binding protein YgfZ [Methylophaga sp.]|nr:folate-binding protein YgfZ [Methylophaga sp.]
MTNSDTLNLQTNNYFTPLEEMGVLQVTGEDATSFLQNLLTNDVAALDINQAQHSGFCNAKGRLFAIFLLIRNEQGYRLILPKNMCDLLLQRLSMYILRSKVSLSNESEHLSCVGLITTNIPSSSNIINHPNDTERFLFICNYDSLEERLSEFKQQGLALAPEYFWAQRDIESGLAMIWPESKEKFTPQQVNLDLVNGVSFSKGCYPGQEVVARLHYLGKPSRRLFIAEAKTHLLPNITDEVTTTDDSIAGHIVSAQLIDESVKLLLSLKLTSSTSSLLLKDGSSIKLQPSTAYDVQ